MAASIVDVDDDLITIRVSGLFTYPELVNIRLQAASQLQHAGMIRCFVLVEDFKGWAKEGDWGENSFQAENAEFIEKMAIVGDREWEDLVLFFSGRDQRRFPIQYFLPEAIDQARRWIAEPA